MQRAVDMYGVDMLAQFTTTAAAMDMHEAMALLAPDSSASRTFIYAISYGTSLAQRFLTLFPDAVDGVVLDGVLAPDITSFATIDAQPNLVGIILMQMCGADATCKEYLGANPVYKVGVRVSR
jgi:pimeloyl-ACP methyl ester carboxylesterase